MATVWGQLNISAVLFALFFVLVVTFLFPILGLVLSYFLKPPKSLVKSELATCHSFEILIPIYNEAESIEPTVQSIIHSINHYNALSDDCSWSLTLCLDGSNQETRNIVLGLQENYNFKLIDRLENRGKWQSINELVKQSLADWCALVDAGTIWPSDFLIKLKPIIHQGEFVAIAPSYQPQKISKIEKIIWKLEKNLKKIENLSGGPCTVHGATAVYQRNVLQAALNRLDGYNWKNDDVVIAMMVRGYGSISYLADQLAVSDIGIKDTKVEPGRRKRIFAGNVEWIRYLLPRLFKQDLLTAVVAGRRVVRVFWAYFILAFTGALSLVFANWLWTFTVIIFLLTPFLIHPKVKIAFRVSLQAPYRIFVLKSHEVSWI